jgi:hypothetical protein
MREGAQHLKPEHWSDPLFLGYALADFRAHTGMDEPALAEILGCSEEALPRLCLRHCPDLAVPDAAHEIDQLAATFGVSPARLTSVLRALARMHGGNGPPAS